jgi:hypothetical protein
MDRSPLSVLLEDFQRAGISDIVASENYDMRTAKIQALSTLSTAIKQGEDNAVGDEMIALGVALTQAKEDLKNSNNKSKSEKITEPEDISVWAFGMENPQIAVLISADVAKETAPLIGKEQQLFAKMMSSIELGAPDVVFLVMQEQVKLSDSGRESVQNKLSSLISEHSPKGLLVVGRTMQEVVKSNEFSNLTSFKLEHPATLLSHPSLKRGAWQTLLELKIVLNN